MKKANKNKRSYAMLFVQSAANHIKKYAFDKKPLPPWTKSLITQLKNQVDQGRAEQAMKQLNHQVKDPGMKQQILQSLPPNIRAKLNFTNPPAATPAATGAPPAPPTATAPAAPAAPGPENNSPWTAAPQPSAGTGNEANFQPDVQKLKQEHVTVTKQIKDLYKRWQDIGMQLQQAGVPANTQAGQPKGLGTQGQPAAAQPAAGGWANSIGRGIGKAVKAPGRALKDFGRGFSSAESTQHILTAGQSSASVLLKR